MRRVRLPPPRRVRQFAWAGDRWAFLLECGHTSHRFGRVLQGPARKVAAFQCIRCEPVLQGGSGA